MCPLCWSTTTLYVMLDIVHPSPSPAWANFPVMMESTPESGHCHSVFVLCVRTLLSILDRPGGGETLLQVRDKRPEEKLIKFLDEKKEESLDKKEERLDVIILHGSNNRKSSKVTEYTECQPFTLVVRIVSPRPLTRKRVLPPPLVPGGGTLTGREGGGG